MLKTIILCLFVLFADGLFRTGRFSAEQLDFELKKVYPKIITPGTGQQDNNLVFFEFYEPRSGDFSILIYDTAGFRVREISSLDKKPFSQSSMNYYLAWDGTDMNNAGVPPGVYVYCLENGRRVFNGTIIVAR